MDWQPQCSHLAVQADLPDVGAFLQPFAGDLPGVATVDLGQQRHDEIVLLGEVAGEDGPQGVRGGRGHDREVAPSRSVTSAAMPRCSRPRFPDTA